MPQVRMMGDDAEEVDAVLEVALAWLRSCPDLIVGSPTRLGHRNGGGRVVFELMLARPAAPQRVQAERVDVPARRRAAGSARRRALPPGGQ
ncbi:hypothetical protein Ssi03_16330 [Sphaerisporangium siamense]|uniref:Uncharacterized protein n=1 Tax=Sphaerisporangium siamense TaxID=795645 RepID=A0A7W7D9T9_9ACTN|nr:hypothetical protein [Sphaerisporangium siamense]MBB4702604.1 hypothetical protein [Sphaerisporangium siamense]GII83643.1 hypothetical protein Ssi03_16330 [Sphaerisporangium siamense]